jgi:hypothetical protein
VANIGELSRLKPSTVPNPTRLTSVVVEPPAYRRDKELGIQAGYYPVGDGLGFWVHPVTKEISNDPPTE